MKKAFICYIILSSIYFTASLCCSVEFRGYTADGKKVINYEFASSHIEWGPAEIMVRNLKIERTTENNVECDAYGWCCNDGTSSGYDCGYAYDCNGHRKYVTYQYREDVYRNDYKLKGGRVIRGEEYIKENETILSQAECLRDDD